MYWLGLKPGDVHLNLSSPGWAKHAWSNFFAPWLAGACVAIYNYERFDAAGLLGVLERIGVTTFCAPPTVWRMLIQADLASARTQLRGVVGAGEPLNPEVIERVKDAWGLTLRDGYGQTELESVLIEHDAVAEAAVVPSPDPLWLAVPKAYVVLAAGWEADRDTALAILRHARENLAPYKRIRRLEFAELPKTISGKIRRVELRASEGDKHADPEAAVAGEYSDRDFPELRE